MNRLVVKICHLVPNMAMSPHDEKPVTSEYQCMVGGLAMESEPFDPRLWYAFSHASACGSEARATS